jgi:hypothetical protein
MSISSVSATAPVQPPYVTTSQTPKPAVSNDNDADDAGAAQPPTPAPLPPGQGTRIDQLV